MLAIVTHLGELHANQPVGIHAAADFWLSIFVTMLYAGPAIIAMVYLLMRDRKLEQMPESQMQEERTDQAA